MKESLLGAACLLAAGHAAFATAPFVTELRPRGAEAGRPFVLTLIGRNLGEGGRISSTMPASFTTVSSAREGPMAMPGTSVSFLVEPKASLAPGAYPVRLETTAGISNVLLFTVGSFPEVTEEESQPYSAPHRNDSIETAEPVPSAPVTVNGTLRGPERDVFRVHGKAGERRVFEVEARRCGSAIDPVLRILDVSGKQLAGSDDSPGIGLDARIDFVFPKEADYYVEVHDARFSTQSQNSYRLKMGPYTYADGIFPLGGRRGEQVPVTYFGSRLATPAKSTVDLRNLESTRAVATAGLPASPALPFLFAVSDLRELIAPVEGGVPVPSVVNGRLEKAGAIDRYRYDVQPGEKLLFEIQARELGTSKLEGIITAFDVTGKKIDSAGDKPLPEDVFAVQGTSRTSSDPFLNVTVPEGAHELTVSVEDLALRGGPLYGYRLIARRQAQDFNLMVNTPYINVPAGGTVMVSVSADRRGYDGPIQLTIPDLPEGLKVEGGMIPREYVDESNTRTYNRRGILIVTAEPGVKSARRDLTIWGEASLGDGTVLRRAAKATGFSIDVAGATAQGVVDRQRPITAPWLALGLPMATAEPPIATLEVRQTGKKIMEEGVRYEYAYEWRIRDTGIRPPEKIDADVIGARDIRVIDMRKSGKEGPGKEGPGKEAASGTFAVTTTKATDPARYDLYISGRLRTAGGDQVIVSRPIPFEVTGGTKPSVASNR